MSCAIIKADVLALAPRLSSLPDAAWVIILAFVNDFKGLDTQPTLRKLALCLLAAHLGVISGSSGSNGATGPVISETVGGLKRTYAQALTLAQNSEYSRTSYGQQFLAIMKMSTGTRGPMLV